MSPNCLRRKKIEKDKNKTAINDTFESAEKKPKKEKILKNCQNDFKFL
jgi:hypothetical protein